MVVRYVDHEVRRSIHIAPARSPPPRGQRPEGVQDARVYSLAKGGRADELYELLSVGGSTSWTEPGTGASAAYIAAATGKAECLRLLLEHGADADARVHTRRTALIAASLAGHLACVAELLDAGADPTLRDAGSKTAE
eukprot:4599497-Prymnesium_polylepis.1